MPRVARSTAVRNSKTRSSREPSSRDDKVSSEEAIRAGEQIAMAAFSSGLKLAAAFGTVAAKTAGLALASLASGADKFSELVREEARRSYRSQNFSIELTNPTRNTVRKTRARRKRVSRA